MENIEKLLEETEKTKFSSNPRDYIKLQDRLIQTVSDLWKENERYHKLGVHITHCNFGENENVCKYGDDDCPALTNDYNWIGRTFQERDDLKRQLADMDDNPRIKHWKDKAEHFLERAEKAEKQLAEKSKLANDPAYNYAGSFPIPRQAIEARNKKIEQLYEQLKEKDAEIELLKGEKWYGG